MKAKRLKSGNILRAHMPYFRRPGHILANLTQCHRDNTCFRVLQNNQNQFYHHQHIAVTVSWNFHIICQPTSQLLISRTVLEQNKWPCILSVA